MHAESKKKLLTANKHIASKEREIKKYCPEIKKYGIKNVDKYFFILKKEYSFCPIIYFK